MKAWAEAQRKLWQRWFDVIKETTKSGTRAKAYAHQAADQSGEGLVDLWDSTARSLLDAQTEWVRR